MYCISSVCCGGESASTASFILLSGQPVKALMIVRSSHDNDGEQGGCGGASKEVAGGDAVREGRNKGLERLGRALVSRT